MRGKGFCAIVLCTFLSLGAARAEQGVSATTIEIGAFGPITGPAAYIGLGGRDGANLAIKEINAAGGINGRKLVLHFEDDGHSPTKALAAVKKLIDEDHVFAIFCVAGSKLDTLRSQHVAFEQAHATAMTERRALSVGREDRAAEAHRKVREVEDRISALAGVIAAQEARVAQLAAEFADAKQGQAREAEAHAVALERALGNLKPAMAEFVNACRAAGAVVMEPMGIGRTMVDILRQVEDDTAYCAELLRQRARAIRQEPPPATPASNATPKPEVRPQPWRQSNLVERLVDWKARAAARIHADASRALSWWQRVFRPNDLAERFVDWKARVAERIHADANRARSWWQHIKAAKG